MWVVNEEQKICLFWYEEKPLTMRSSFLAILSRKPHANYTILKCMLIKASTWNHLLSNMAIYMCSGMTV